MSSQDFQLISKLGDGAFSSVWKARRISDNQEYAMKKVKITPLSDKEKHNALNEVRILASISNPYIIGYKEAFFEENPLTLCIVMEYAGGGDIFSLVTKHKKNQISLKEQDIWRFSTQMLMGLKALHGMKILHRDLKCANVFLSTDSKTAKLGDLNVSKVTKNDLAYTQTGTPYYASPEVWRDQPYDAKSDIWSLGCVIYEMCALRPPFHGKDMPSLNDKIQKGIFERIPFQYSNDLQNFISLCLQVKPSARPTSEYLLCHPIVRRNAGLDVVQDMVNPTSPNNLLDTIKFPRNFRALVLPKANYSPDPCSLETKRDRYSSRGVTKKGPEDTPSKRPISQYAPASKGRVMIRETYSRDRNSSHLQRPNSSNVNNISKESEQDYIARMQKEYIDKAKIYKPLEPRRSNGDLMDQVSRPRVSPLRKIVEPVEPRPRSRIGEPKPTVRDYILNIQDSRDKLRSREIETRKVLEEIPPKHDPVISQIRQRLYSREKRPEVEENESNLTQRQKLLINKYQSIPTNEVKIETPFTYSEKAHLLLRKADSLIEKYQSRDGVSSRQEYRRPVVTPSNMQREKNVFSVDHYQNQLNQRIELGIGNRENDRNYLNRDYSNLVSNKAKLELIKRNSDKDLGVKREQIHRKIITRPF